MEIFRKLEKASKITTKLYSVLLPEYYYSTPLISRKLSVCRKNGICEKSLKMPLLPRLLYKVSKIQKSMADLNQSFTVFRIKLNVGY